ncbi:MAG: helix-turn-helix transcriptional regulator [Thermoguttaceae bacterium]|jgi:poly-beta-hydroxybutyrate-responsive repressor
MRNRDECPCEGTTLAKLLQPAILTVLAEGELHGYRIVERLADMPILSGSPPDSTGVYRFLRVMEGRGLLTSSWDTSSSGPAKRLYRLTKDGRKCLARWVKTLTHYCRAIGDLLDMAQRTLTS